jgi:hypothetical protein
MTLVRISSKEIKILYYDLTGSLGFYRCQPQQAPYICLSTKLLDHQDEEMHQIVFETLLEQHRSIPLDSPYRLFPMRTYYETLTPVVTELDAADELVPKTTVRTLRPWRIVDIGNGMHIVGQNRQAG